MFDVERVKKEWKDYERNLNSGNVDQFSHSYMASKVGFLLSEIEKLESIIEEHKDIIYADVKEDKINDEEILIDDKEEIIPTEEKEEEIFIVETSESKVLLVTYICLQNYGPKNKPLFIKGNIYEGIVADQVFLNDKKKTIELITEQGEKIYIYTEEKDLTIPDLFAHYKNENEV